MGEKLCVVTGTSAGIGRRVAEELLNHGWQVVGISRREAPITHEAYHHVTLDLTDLPRLESYFEQRFAREMHPEQYGRVGLVNNAALLGQVQPIKHLQAEGLAQAYLVNAVAPVWLMGYFLRAFPTAKLRMVNVSSGAAARPYPGWAVYCSTKAALRMAGMVLGAEVEQLPSGHAGSRDLALVSYEPGVVDTAMQTQVRSTPEEDFPNVQRFIDFHREGQLNPPERPAAEIVSLLERDDLPPFSEMRLGQ